SLSQRITSCPKSLTARISHSTNNSNLNRNNLSRQYVIGIITTSEHRSRASSIALVNEADPFPSAFLRRPCVLFSFYLKAQKHGKLACS
ncbi:hypothetical protein PTTG_30028, partial [Puccinia triticina 1-1 BBBD Race 1]